MPTMSKSSTTIETPELREGDLIPLVTPGEVLREEFLEPMGITAYALAKAIGVPPPYISKVLHGGGISAELGVLLDRYFGMSGGFWSRLQANHNSRVAKRKLADHIARIEPYSPVAGGANG
jgi:addiction module HigA family antidote